MPLRHWTKVDGARRGFAVCLALLVMLGYGIAIHLTMGTLGGDRATDEANQRLRMSATGVEPGRTPPDPLPATGNFTTVRVGTYLDAIDTVSIRDSNWTGDFIVWFAWTGDPKLDPAGHMTLVDGEITAKELQEEDHNPDGTNYQRYRVSARFKKFFNTTLVPMERPQLNIFIEDGERDASVLRYVADPTSGISSRATSPGYHVVAAATVVKPHTYRTSFGQGEKRRTFSQFVAGVSLVKAGMGVYLKIFMALYAAQALALAAFFVYPADVSPRFALPTAAYFGAVANSYIANSILPPSDVFGLVDYVEAFGLATIFLTVALSLLSNFMCGSRNDPALALLIDRVMFYTLGLCCLAANILIPSVVL
jgi:hypothetical protein